jgi:hypothetical protein
MRRAVVLGAVLAVATAASAQYAGPGGAVPVVANNAGLQGTLWRSDVSITNLETSPTAVVLMLFPEIVDDVPEFEFQMTEPIAIPASGQVTFNNVLQSVFGLTEVKGALQVITTDGAPVLVSSRVFNVPEGGGSFGQDAQAILVADQASAGGLAHDAFYRTNIGIFLPADPGNQQVVFEVTVRAADGSQVGSGFVTFTEPGVVQKSLSAFGVGLLVDGWVSVTCSDPGLTWYGYASRVDEVTGDAVFRPMKGFATNLP